MNKTVKGIHSIRLQIALAFILMMTCTMVMYLVINNLFLEKFYIQNKQRGLVSSYYAIDQLFNSDGSISDSALVDFRKVCNTSGMEVAVVSPSIQTIISSSGKDDLMVMRLLDHVFGFDDFTEKPAPSSNETSKNGIFKKDVPKGEKKPFGEKAMIQNDDFEVLISADPRMGMDYLELWGTLSNGNFIIMRTAISNIKASVKVSNKFLWNIGILMILVGGIIGWIITSKISRPIMELADISEKMAHLDFNAKYKCGGKNEIAVLGNHMNELSETLEKTISELKTANNELKRDIENKEQLNGMRLDFLSNVAHELKTPIALIQGYAEGLRDNINDDEESRNFYCDVIIDESDKMNKMVKNLMTLNQLEFGDEITLERFDIVELIKNCMQSSDIMLKQNEIIADFCVDEPIYVWADEFKMEEVFTNYFSNAIHYCTYPANARSDNRQKRIEVTIEQKIDTVRVSVFNTGNPIPEESIDHLWDKFYKVDKARTHEYGGSGIGLSIVKAIMNSHNKSFGATNYENGVAFWFELDSKGD
ncbi:MAG: HAMP domain-containing histidine kinase [Lachnospiraceae bacterium]|nr:HAMP domain-containing histidine kinase [Lachnospiraceae bacterium]